MYILRVNLYFRLICFILAQYVSCYANLSEPWSLYKLRSVPTDHTQPKQTCWFYGKWKVCFSVRVFVMTVWILSILERGWFFETESFGSFSFFPQESNCPLFWLSTKLRNYSTFTYSFNISEIQSPKYDRIFSSIYSSFSSSYYLPSAPVPSINRVYRSLPQIAVFSITWLKP